MWLINASGWTIKANTPDHQIQRNTRWKKHKTFMASKSDVYCAMQIYRGQMLLNVIQGCAVVYVTLKENVLVELLDLKHGLTLTIRLVH